MIKSEDNMRHFQYPQRIEFNAQEDQHSVELLSNNVTIVPSPGGHNHGSSKVKLRNVVDFTWEHNFYTGQLLAVHMSGKYLAYGIKVGSGGGVVRVVNQELELRALLRGMHGAIQDLAFAHVSNAILACVDCSGSLFVHTIEVAPSELLCSLVLRVDAKDEAPLTHRVIWCPYIPEDDPSDGDEVSKLLVLTRGSKAELWSVAMIASKFRSIEANDPAVRESGGMLEINQHSDMIVEAAFSPDGTALATASLDGEVKFFQVYMQNSGTQPQPRCLHQWKPHGGRPISCLFFLDDHKNYQPDVQFWRFAVTGCDNNSELKVWSCELWTCLQTIKFTATPGTNELPVLKAGLDLSASYLLLSDIYNKVLYILSISKDSGEAVACVSTVSQFLLPYPILSFNIVDAGQRKIRPTGGSLEDLCPCDEETEDQLVIRMYLVQPKSLQECDIAFKPASQIGGNCLMDTLTMDTHDSLDYSEDLPDMTVVNHNGITVENGEEDRSLSATIEAATNHTTGLNLMTPDAFSSPAKKENNEDTNSTGGSFELAKTNASPSLAQVVQALNAVETTNGNELEEQTPASGGSSPSREVREILSLTKTNEDDVENESNKTLEITKPVVKEEWLDFPIAMLKDMNVHAMQQQPQKSEEFSNGSPSIIQRKIPTKEEIVAKENENAWQLINERYIQDLNNKIESMLEIIQDQRQELRDLRGEVTRLRQETPISARIEAVLKAAQQQNANLEQSLYGQMTRQREFINLIDLTIKEKMETTLPPLVEAAVDPLKHQLRLDTVRMDEVFKENLTQLINSTQIKDTLSKAAANAAKPALDSAFRETFTNVFLPGMEKTCQNMFRQVQDAFVRGTREYLQNVGAITENQCQQRNNQQNDTLTALIREELQTEFTRGITNLQKTTLRTVRDSIRDNLSQQFTEFSGVRSRATTPAIPTSTTADAQSTILSLLQRGQLNSAFQQALTASDLNLVVLVCEKTEPSRVLSCPLPSGQGTRCILPQPVILSLVQQLSADLGHRTELKHRWLEEAILSLDPTDPVTREHMGKVLITLQNQLVTFMEANPNHQSIRHMKMLAMATQALLSQHP